MLEGNLNKILNTICPAYNFLRHMSFNCDFRRKHERILLERNRCFYNRHFGERCFVLGNGPSLKNTDLSVLKDEIVFTVNQAYRHNQFAALQSNYHFWIDNNFFKIDVNNDPDDNEMFNTMKKVASEKNISCFYPLTESRFVEKYKLDKNMNAYYLYPNLRLYDRYNLKCDISTGMPSFGTVVQYAIFTAIYMGIKEIYLLGCDSTGIMSTINAILKTPNNTYGYEVTDVERRRMENMVARSSVIDYAYTYYCSLKGYKILFNYCKSRSVTLCNCTDTSVLDMLPYKDLNKVLIIDKY